MTTKAVEKRLTTRQVQMAMLDAWGYNATEIGKALDCTPDYIRKSRREAWFPVEREKWLSSGSAQMETIIEALKTRSLGVHGEALEELQEALHASDSDDNPLWAVRLKAIEIALNHKIIQAIVGAVDEGRSVTAAVTQVTLNFLRDPDGNPTLRPEDWIEGEVVDPVS